ncbi:MAG: SurA N-terminal domain-containing protein [Deltaproteobacteria bacterium]|nr:SurA N-terminal domain-containing protein [Deltaproteobacteria bacterium]
MKPKRIRTLIFAPFLLALILAFGVTAFKRHYIRQLWDPLTAATVNGLPIPRSAIEEVMVFGYHLPPNDEGQETILQLLDRLIDEELVRQAAEKEGIKISEEEISAQLESYRRSFGCLPGSRLEDCRQPKGPSGESLAKAVEKQLLLQTMGRIIHQTRARPSSREWRSFWRAWLAKYSLSSVYKVKVLLVEDQGDAEEYLTPSRQRKELEDMADAARKAGLTARITEPMTINLLDPATLTMFRKANLALELAKALNDERRLTAPIKLSGSWAVFEVISLVKPIEPANLALAARNAYERQVGEKAYQAWLEDLRREAVIVINPNLLESAEKGGLADVFSPRVAWEEGMSWDEDPSLEQSEEAAFLESEEALSETVPTVAADDSGSTPE